MVRHVAAQAEREGFEPSVPVRAQLLSREPDSATLAPLPIKGSPLPPLRHVTGESGIRTHGTREGTTVFKTASLNRSDTSPVRRELY